MSPNLQAFTTRTAHTDSIDPRSQATRASVRVEVGGRERKVLILLLDQRGIWAMALLSGKTWDVTQVFIHGIHGAGILSYIETP